MQNAVLRPEPRIPRSVREKRRRVYSTGLYLGRTTYLFFSVLASIFSDQSLPALLCAAGKSLLANRADAAEPCGTDISAKFQIRLDGGENGLDNVRASRRSVAAAASRFLKRRLFKTRRDALAGSPEHETGERSDKKAASRRTAGEREKKERTPGKPEAEKRRKTAPKSRTATKGADREAERRDPAPPFEVFLQRRRDPSPPHSPYHASPRRSRATLIRALACHTPAASAPSLRHAPQYARLTSSARLPPRCRSGCAFRPVSALPSAPVYAFPSFPAPTSALSVLPLILRARSPGPRSAFAARLLPRARIPAKNGCKSPSPRRAFPPKASSLPANRQKRGNFPPLPLTPAARTLKHTRTLRRGESPHRR